MNYTKNIIRMRYLVYLTEAIVVLKYVVLKTLLIPQSKIDLARYRMIQFYCHKFYKRDLQRS